MLKYKVGCLIEAALKGDVDVIAHGCNTFCTMGSGIAKEIKKCIPKMYAEDLKTEKGDRTKLGSYTLAVMNEGKLAGFNLYTQYGYNGRRMGIRDLNYNALYDSLAAMRDCLQRHTDGFMSDYKIGLPKIGAGLAGGDWKIIETMIESVLHDCDVTIYVLNEEEIPDGKREHAS